MNRSEALEMFAPLPIPTNWIVYASVPDGEVAAAVPGLGRILRAALLLHELGLASIVQRRTALGTDYLIRRVAKPFVNTSCVADSVTPTIRV